MSLTLRPYQQECLAKLFDSLRSCNSSLIVLATGLGKTVIFVTALHQLRMQTGKRMLVLAHREELILQAAAKIELITGMRPDIEMGDRWADVGGLLHRAPYLVSSIQTLTSDSRGEPRMRRFNPKDFSAVVIDEAHHAPAASYRRVIEYFQTNPNLKVIGCTATPDRADEQALGQIFQSVAYEFGIDKGIEAGYLVPIYQRVVHVESLDFSHIHTVAGDLNGAELAEIMEREENLHRIATPTYELCGNRKTLIFAVTVKQATSIAEILNRHEDGCARVVEGKTPKELRAQLLSDFKNGAFRFLVNCAVATEGFDEPGIQVVVMAQPTKSRSRYVQMVGRGTRPVNGDEISLIGDADRRREAIANSKKPKMEVIDFTGNSGRHSLITIADILGGRYSNEVVERVKKEAKENASAQDISKALEVMEEKLRLEKEEAEKRKHIKATATYRSTVTDPFNAFGIPAPEPNYKAHKLTEAQLADVQKSFDLQSVDHLSEVELSRLHGELIRRRRGNLCTPKQARQLAKYRLPTNVRFKIANDWITLIANNRWKLPAELAEFQEKLA